MIFFSNHGTTIYHELFTYYIAGIVIGILYIYILCILLFYHPNNPIRYYSCFHYEVKTLKFKLVKILSKFWHKVDEKNPDSNSRFGSTIGFHILTLYPETLLNSHKL